MTYNVDIYSTFAFLGFLVVLIPLKWNLLTWNTGGCMYILWTAISCLNWFINSRLFKGNALDRAPAWCEIVTRFEIAFQVAIPACSLAINRRLYMIASCRRAQFIRGEKLRMVLCDLAICLGLPLLQIVGYTIVQGHRYNIYEDVGCVMTIYNTWMAIIMVYTWPIIIGLVSAVYCALTIAKFFRRWKETREFLKSGDGLTFSRYLRLMSLAATDLFLTVPLASFALYLNTQISKVQPWLGWNDTHQGFNRVIQVPSPIWHLNHYLVIGKEFERWIPVVCAFVFFALFGCASEARRNYTLLINSIGRATGIKALASFGVISQQPQSSKTGGMPRFAKSNGSSNATDSTGAMGIEPKGGPSDSFFAHVDFSALGGDAEKKDDEYSPTSTGPSDASLHNSPTDDRAGPFSPTGTGSSRGSIAPSIAPGLGRERADSLESMHSVVVPPPRISISSERRSQEEPRHTSNMV